MNDLWLCVKKGNIGEVKRIASLMTPNNLSKNCSERIADVMKRKDLEMAKFLISSGAKVISCPGCSDAYFKNKRSLEEHSPNLHVAVAHADVETIEMIINRGISIRNEDNDSIIPIFYLAQRNPVDEESSRILDYFLEKGVDVNDQHVPTGFRLIHFAAKYGNINLIPLIIKKNCELDAKSLEGLTALHIAVVYKHPEVVSLLLSHGAQPNIEDKYQRTPLSLALLVGSGRIIDILYRHIIDNKEFNLINECSHLKINSLVPYYAAAAGMKEIIETFIIGGGDVNTYCLDSGKTLVHLAAENGHEDIVKILLNASANPNVVQRRVLQIQSVKFLIGETGYTPLHYASLSGYEGIVNLLLDHGASPNFMDENGETPLHIAAKSGSLSIVRTLLDGSTDFNTMFSGTRDRDYRPLEIAIENNHEKIVEILLDKGMCPNYLNKKGLRPFHLAVQFSNTNILKILLNKGASFYDKDISVPSILHFALYKNSDERMIRFLLLWGVDVNVKNHYGNTPLFRAVWNFKHLCQLFLDYGAEVNGLYVDSWTLDKETLIHYVVNCRRFKELNLLFEYDIDINMENADGTLGYYYFYNVGYLKRYFTGAHHNLSNCDSDDEILEVHRDKCEFRKFEGHIPARTTMRSMVKMIAKLKAEKKYIHTQNQKLIDDEFLKPYFYVCQKEIEQMRRTDVGEGGVTYFDIFIAKESKLARYVINRTITDVFVKKTHVNLFPEYADFLNVCIKKGMKRKYLVERGVRLLRKALNFNLPHMFFYDVLQYLTTLDLIHFGAAFFCEPPEIIL